MIGAGTRRYIKHQLDVFGWRALPKLTSELLHRFPDHEEDSIWDSDWQLLVILDACRVDWMKTVADEYSFIEEVESHWSVGGHSEEFLEKTFLNAPETSLQDIGYVTANHFASNVAAVPFAVFDDVTRYEYQANAPAPPAHVVTDRAISVSRSNDINQLIVHYMQPHKPFINPGAKRSEVSVEEWSMGEELYTHYFDRSITRKELHEKYINNLRYVLDEVSKLLDNVDAPKAVITSDHGHALGERFLWDHRRKVQHPEIRRVPWVETTATDTEGLIPSNYETVEKEEQEIEDQLAALGYR